MTKFQMMEEIDRREQNAWERMQEYAYNNTPRVSRDQMFEFQQTDPTYQNLLYEWAAYYELCETFGIVTKTTPRASKLSFDLYRECEAAESEVK